MNRFPKKICISLGMSVPICFILISAAMILPAAQCAYHLSGQDREIGKPRSAGVDEIPTASDGLVPSPCHVHREAETRTLLRQLLTGILISLVCIIGVFLFLMKTMVAPTRRLAAISIQMAEGRLDAAVPQGPRNEIGRIGGAINELAVNLQEILLHVWNHSRGVTALLNQIREAPSETMLPGVKRHAEEILREIQDLQTLVRAFACYDIHLEDGRILAADARDDHRPDGPSHRTGLEAPPVKWDLGNSN